MSLLALRVGVDFRRHWRAWVVYVVLAGAVGGATVAALAGARRTETAYARFLRTTAAFDILVANGGTTPDNVNRQFRFDEVARLPEVADAAFVRNYFPRGTAPSGRSFGQTDVVAFGSADGKFGTALNRARVLQGRMPTAEDEVAVSFLARDSLGLEVGTTVRLQLGGPAVPEPPPSDFRVVGTVAIQAGFPPSTGGLPPPLLLSPAYTRAHRDSGEVFALRLRNGVADLPKLAGDLNRLGGGEQYASTDRVEMTSVVQRSLTVQATALRLFSVLLAVVAVLLLGQGLARYALVDSDDHRVLQALGATRLQLPAPAIARSAVLGLTAALVATVVAVGLSALTPVGVARSAEPSPGVEVNLAYVVCGAMALFLIIGIVGSVAALRSTPRVLAARLARSNTPGGGRTAASFARAGFSAPAVSGIRMAFESGRGRSGVPAGSTVISAALGLATVAAVIGFTTSLGNLFNDPHLYGWNWDVQVGDEFSPGLAGEAEALASDPAVEALAQGTMLRLQIGGLIVGTLATESRNGVIEPTVVAGRAPRGPDEILLGSRTMRQLGLAMGDTITVSLGDAQSRVTVVGRGVLTENGGSARLGEGAAMTFSGARRLQPDAETDVLLLRLKPGAGGRALLERLVAEPPGNLYLPAKPSDLANLERVGGLPSLLAGLMGAMALATVIHALVTSVRRRRRDLAVLKVLGFVRRQVLGTVAWQATALAVAGLAIGVPLGIAAGRWTWTLYADQLGVPPRAATPVVTILLTAAASVLVANVASALPGRLAARTRPAVALRTE